MSVPWPEEREQALRKLVAEGLSAGQIGQRLGVTRNAVIGKVVRLGIQLAGNHGGGWAKGKLRSTEPKPVPIKRPSPQPRGWKRDVYVPPRLIPIPPPESPPDGSLTIFELPATMTACRFPYGARVPFLFCGLETKDGEPYCEAHKAKVLAKEAV